MMMVAGGCAHHRQGPVVDSYPQTGYQPDGTAIGWLWPEGKEQAGPVPYVPREGDIIFTSSISLRMTSAYVLLGRVGLPHHVLMVVRRGDGQLVAFEVGAGADKQVKFRPLCPRLAKHKSMYPGSVVAVRQIKRPLSAEESARLTCFAESQLGKAFFEPREFVPYLLPGRPAPPTRLAQTTWCCSELVAQALQSAGLMVGGPNPRDLSPEDLYHDDTCNLSPLWNAPLDWTPQPTPTVKRPLFDPGRKQ